MYALNQRLKEKHFSDNPNTNRLPRRTERLVRSIKRTMHSRKSLRRNNIIGQNPFVVKQRLSIMVQMHFKEAILFTQEPGTLNDAAKQYDKLERIYKKRLDLQECCDPDVPIASKPSEDEEFEIQFPNSHDDTPSKLAENEEAEMQLSIRRASSPFATSDFMTETLPHLSTSPYPNPNTRYSNSFECSNVSYESNESSSSASKFSDYESSSSASECSDSQDQLKRVVSVLNMPNAQEGGDRRQSCSSLSAGCVKQLLTLPIDSKHESDWSNEISTAMKVGIYPRTDKSVETKSSSSSMIDTDASTISSGQSGPSVYSFYGGDCYA
jgi:hypothetical protein